VLDPAATEDRKYRTAVGYGPEPILTGWQGWGIRREAGRSAEKREIMRRGFPLMTLASRASSLLTAGVTLEGMQPVFHSTPGRWRQFPCQGFHWV